MVQKPLLTFGNLNSLASAPPNTRLRSALGPLRASLSRAALFPGLMGSLALLPLAMLQGSRTRRRVPILPPAAAPHHGLVDGEGDPIRLLAVGESSVCGIGVSRSNETVAAVTAGILRKLTKRPIVWRALGLSGATVRDGISQLLPRVRPEPIDLCIIAFGVNDTTSYRSPRAFADDLELLVRALRDRVGNAAVVVAGVAPINCFPALPWPLRTILGWRSKALQAAIEGLTRKDKTIREAIKRHKLDDATGLLRSRPGN